MFFFIKAKVKISHKLMTLDCTLSLIPIHPYRGVDPYGSPPPVRVLWAFGLPVEEGRKERLNLKGASGVSFSSTEAR